MAKKSKKKKSTNKTDNNNTISSSSNDGFIQVDPQRIRFQHSRIRPHFSGCGRSVQSTLDSIRNKEITPQEIPPIQVIVGPDENDGLGPWYFSLNNRRLWVFKRCREEGLLVNNLIRVRVRQPKSAGEFERYSLDNCAVEAKFMREREPKKSAKGNNYHSVQNDTEEKSSGEIPIRQSVEDLKIDFDDDLPKNIENDHGNITRGTKAFIASDSAVIIHYNDQEDEEESSDEEEENVQPMNTNRFVFEDSSSDESDDD